jgi:hypothetical protein
MPLTQASLGLAITYALSRANVPFLPTIYGPESKTYELLPDVTVFNELYAGHLTIAAGANQEIDLQSFVNLALESVVLTKALILVLIPSGANAAVKLEPGTTNPFPWFLTGTTPGVTVPTGGLLVFAQPTAQAVSGTSKTLKFSNPGSGALTLDVFLFGGT